MDPKSLEVLLKLESNFPQSLFSPDIKSMLESNRHVVLFFEKKNDIKCQEIYFAEEKGYVEPYYIFNDGLGGYTREGMISSLVISGNYNIENNISRKKSNVQLTIL